MSKAFKENYLSQSNGCQVIQTSSEKEGTSANNILHENPKQLWFIDESLPQYCIIDTSRLATYPKVFNRICFYCWHEYESNPQLIEVAYSKNEDEGWTVAGKIRLERVAQKQYFKIKQIPVTQMKLLRLTILKNFGDKNTYLNQVELGFVKQGFPQNSREKTFSQFVKLTSTERQLKRALDQIKYLTHEHQQLKETVKKQNQLISKTQDSMKKMAKHLQKMFEIQQFQTAKIKMLQEGSKKGTRSGFKQTSQEKIRYNSKDISSDSEQEQQRCYIQDNLINHKISIANPNKSSSFHKNSKSKAVNCVDSKKTSKMQSIIKSRELDSDPNLSQYHSDENEGSRLSEKCTSLVFKLQKLLIEKEKRQKQLAQKRQKDQNQFD